ncbi:hypothetical protein, partial [Candidatus Pseudothioglobus singularis]
EGAGGEDFRFLHVSTD